MLDIERRWSEERLWLSNAGWAQVGQQARRTLDATKAERESNRVRTAPRKTVGGQGAVRRRAAEAAKRERISYATWRDYEPWMTALLWDWQQIPLVDEQVEAFIEASRLVEQFAADLAFAPDVTEEYVGQADPDAVWVDPDEQPALMSDLNGTGAGALVAAERMPLRRRVVCQEALQILVAVSQQRRAVEDELAGRFEEGWEETRPMLREDDGIERDTVLRHIDTELAQLEATWRQMRSEGADPAELRSVEREGRRLRVHQREFHARREVRSMGTGANVTVERVQGPVEGISIRC